MNPTVPPPVVPLEDEHMMARQAHFEREVARPRVRAPRRRLVRGGFVAAAALAAIAVLLTGRGGSDPDAVAKALAAVSRGRYLGIVLHTTRTRSSTLVHLESHSTESVGYEIEMWFDTSKHGAAASVGGCSRFVGRTTRSGCIGSMMMVSGDATLFTGSIDGYRAALAAGKVAKAGTATVRGHSASWLRFQPAAKPLYRAGWVTYVAVDQQTGNALRIETRKGEKVVGREDIDVLPQTRRVPAYVLTPASQFAHPPKLTPGKRHGRGGAPATLAQAARAVPGALWPGRSAAGQPFRSARIITLDTGEPQLELRYGGACPKACVLVKQGRESGWAPGSRLYSDLPNHSIVINGGRYADGRSDDIRIRIEGTDRATVLAAARAMRPLP